eukprot:359938-Chlamydomonas_euryale.AAC.9
MPLARIYLKCTSRLPALRAYKSLRWPVTLSSTDLGAGPIASTVCEPAGICVLPASCTMYVGMPSEEALAASVFCDRRGNLACSNIHVHNRAVS